MISSIVSRCWCMVEGGLSPGDNEGWSEELGKVGTLVLGVAQSRLAACPFPMLEQWWLLGVSGGSGNWSNFAHHQLFYCQAVVLCVHIDY